MKKSEKVIESNEVGYRGFFILTFIILIGAIGIIGFLVNHITKNRIEINDLREELSNIDKPKCEEAIIEKEYFSHEDLVSVLFSNKLSKESTISDYSIDDVFIENTEEFISGQYSGNYVNVKTDSIFAVVTYSVKPIGSYGKSIWNNNNGVFEEEWVKGKKTYLYISKTDDGYVINGDGYGVKW